MPKKLYKVSDSSIHQRGFLPAKIKEGADIIQYVGKKSQEGIQPSCSGMGGNARVKGEGLVYIFELDDDWDIDGQWRKIPPVI